MISAAHSQVSEVFTPAWAELLRLIVVMSLQKCHANHHNGASPFQGELVRPLLSCTTPLPLKVGAYPGIGSGTAKNALHISQRSRTAVRFIEIIIIRLTVAKQEGNV